MSVNLHELDWMQDAAKEYERLNSGGKGGTWMSLYGTNAIVQPGESKQVRLLPNPKDITSRYVKGPKGPVENPNFKPGAIYVKAIEHWFEGADNKRTRVWCPKTFDAKVKCPLCDEAEALHKGGSKQDQEAAREIGPKEVFLFGAILGPEGKRATKDNGSPDFRILPVPPSIWMSVMDIMRGTGENEAFAAGLITDVKDGFDVLLTRPAKGQKNTRWSVTCAKKSTRLFTKEEAVAEWWKLMPDIMGELSKERQTAEDISALYYGTSGEGASEGSGDAAEEPTDFMGTDEEDAGEEAVAEEEGGDFLGADEETEAEELVEEDPEADALDAALEEAAEEDLIEEEVIPEPKKVAKKPIPAAAAKKPTPAAAPARRTPPKPAGRPMRR